MCVLAKLTGCAPGKLVWCRPRISATSLRIANSSCPSALSPGSDIDAIGPCDGPSMVGDKVKFSEVEVRVRAYDQPMLVVLCLPAIRQLDMCLRSIRSSR